MNDPNRGRIYGLSGRRPKDQESRVQMLVNVDEDNVYHTIPKQKKTHKKAIYSLTNAVECNKHGFNKY